MNCYQRGWNCDYDCRYHSGTLRPDRDVVWGAADNQRYH
nr:MAG TPA: Per1-like family protein [Caudoviricetes sp.]DAU53769.1 MAG TPA: Per1-like family protein [Caudoviricetes sp.]